MKRLSVSGRAFLCLCLLAGCSSPNGFSPYGVGTSSAGGSVAMNGAFYRGGAPIYTTQSLAWAGPAVPLTAAYAGPQTFAYNSGPYSTTALASAQMYGTPRYGQRRGHRRHMNVSCRPNSTADRARRQEVAVTRLAQNGEIAPGIAPSPNEDLKYRGGRTIQHLEFINIYVGGDSSWDPNDIKQIDWALAAAMSDEYLNNVMMQYFGNQPLSNISHPSKVLQGPKPAVVTKGDVENIVDYLYKQGNLKGFNLPNTVFNFMLPRGTTLTDDDGPAGSQQMARSNEAESAPKNGAIPHEDEVSSQGGLGGFHGSIHNGSDTIYYAVGVYSERLSNGKANGIPVFDQNWKNVVATFYHELQEARTDPDVEDAIRAGDDPAAERYLGWTSDRGEECGDYPVSEAAELSSVFKEVALADGSGMVPIQFQYSNAVHGPEGPTSAAHGPVPPPHDVPHGPPPGTGTTGTGTTPSSPGAPPVDPGDTGLAYINEKWAGLPLPVRKKILGLMTCSP